MCKFQVYRYARKFAKIGIVGALVGSLQAELSSPCLVSASIALKAVAVNVSALSSYEILVVDGLFRVCQFSEGGSHCLSVIKIMTFQPNTYMRMIFS